MNCTDNQALDKIREQDLISEMAMIRGVYMLSIPTAR